MIILLCTVARDEGIAAGVSSRGKGRDVIRPERQDPTQSRSLSE